MWLSYDSKYLLINNHGVELMISEQAFNWYFEFCKEKEG